MTFRNYLKNILNRLKNYIDNSFSGINIKKFGAKGDGITDDTDAIQSAINYAIENNIYNIFFPAPKVFYKITKPILIQCYSSQNGTIDDVSWWEGRAPRLFGDNKSTSIIKKVGNSTLKIPENNWDGFKESVDSTFILANKDGGERGSGIIIENLNIKNDSTSKIHYGIFGDRSRCTIRHCNVRTNSKGIKLHSFFNELSDLYISCSNNGIDISNGTSTILERIYCSSGMTDPFKIISAYSTLSCCCADGCLGKIFDVGGYGVTLNGCGSESAQSDYYISVNADSNVVVNGFYGYRQVGGCPFYFADDASLTVNGIQLIEKSSVSDYGESYLVDVGSENWTTVRFNLSNFSIMRTPSRNGQLPKLFKKVPRIRSKIYLSTDDLNGCYQVTELGLIPYEGKGNSRMYLDDVIINPKGNIDTSKLFKGFQAFSEELCRPQFYDGNGWYTCPPEIIGPENTNFIETSEGKFISKPKFTNKFDTNDSNYAQGYRMTSSGILTEDQSFFVSGFISAPNEGDIIRVRSKSIMSTVRPLLCQFNPDTFEVMGSPYWAEGLQMDSDGKGFSFEMPYSGRCIRVSDTNSDNFVVTVNQEIIYENVWNGPNPKLNKDIYSQNTLVASSSGKLFKLKVTEDGVLGTQLFEE